MVDRLEALVVRVFLMFVRPEQRRHVVEHG